MKNNIFFIKTKFTVKILIVYFLNLISVHLCVASDLKPHELFALNWGSKDNEIGYSLKDNIYKGPWGFYVSDNSIFISDVHNNAIKVFSLKGELLRKVDVAVHPTVWKGEFWVDHFGNICLPSCKISTNAKWDGGISIISKEGTGKSVDYEWIDFYFRKNEVEKNNFMSFENKDSACINGILDQNYEWSSEGYVLLGKNFLNILNNDGPVSLLFKPHKPIWDVWTSTYLLGLDNKSNLYLYVYFKPHYAEYSAAYIYVYNSSGALINVINVFEGDQIELPTNYFVACFGGFYETVTKKEEMKFVKWSK